MKNILIISASPRKGGNSDLLCDQFAKGACEVPGTGQRTEWLEPVDNAVCAEATKQ